MASPDTASHALGRHAAILQRGSEAPTLFNLILHRVPVTWQQEPEQQRWGLTLHDSYRLGVLLSLTTVGRSKPYDWLLLSNGAERGGVSFSGDSDSV